MFFPLYVQLSNVDRLGGDGCWFFYHGWELVVFGAAGLEVWGATFAVSRGLKLLEEEEGGEGLVGVEIGLRDGLVLVFFVFALSHGFSVLDALRSSSRAVPYFASLAGHLLESAGWSWSTLGFAMQLTHLVL